MNLLYLNRLIGCLTAIVKVLLEEGIAHRWNFEVDETWDALDFLSAVSPGLLCYEAERRRTTVLELKESLSGYRPWEGFSSTPDFSPNDTQISNPFRADYVCQCLSTPTPSNSNENLGMYPFASQSERTQT